MGLIPKISTGGILFGLSSLLPLLSTGPLNNIGVPLQKNSNKNVASLELALFSLQTLLVGLLLAFS